MALHSKSKVLWTWLISSFVKSIECAPLNESNGSAQFQNINHVWLLGIVISVSFFIASITFFALCGAGCLRNIKIFGRKREQDPVSFSNPVGSQLNNCSLSPIDARALELDPVVFEPLPTLSDISPAALKLNIDPVVPFSSNETNIYAHDWFDEPYINFSRGQIEYLKEVGKGWFGQVIEAEAQDIVPYTKKLKVWIKVLRESSTATEQMRFLDESRLYRDANHGNILKLLGQSIETSPFLLIMEHCPQGDLKGYLIKNVSRAEILNSQGSILRMGLDIAKGLEWMLMADCVHGDLSARNCQVGSEGRILIGDYGLATQTYKDDYYWSGNIAIPLRWASPETLHCTINTIQTLKVTAQSNIWTFGILLWEIAEFGKLPYFELNCEEVISRVIIQENYTLGQPTMPSFYSREKLYNLMKSCWSPNPLSRPPISYVVQTLESLLNEQCEKGAENFETKWEQMSSAKNNTPISTNTTSVKKSVSFVGMEKEDVGGTVISDQKHNQGNVLGPEETIDKIITNNDFEEPLSDVWKETEEDRVLRHRVERGEISKKVLEKSQSVQDLMVLTHFCPDEDVGGDPDSLVSINANSSYNSQVGIIISASTSPPTNIPSSYLRKSSSESSVNFNLPSSTNNSPATSSQNNKNIWGGKTNNYHAAPAPDQQQTPKNYNTSNHQSGKQINVVESTPSPSVKINLIQSTPSPFYDQEKEKHRQHDEQEISDKPQQRLLKFKFDSPAGNGEQIKNRRRTSTPIKTPSPTPIAPAELEDVFEPKDSFGNVSSVSPIKSSSSYNNEYRNTLDSLSESSVVFGADDELGLRPFQSVTSNNLYDDSSKLDLNEEQDIENEQSKNHQHVSAIINTDANKRVKRSIFLNENEGEKEIESSSSVALNSWSIIDSNKVKEVHDLKDIQNSTWDEITNDKQTNSGVSNNSVSVSFSNSRDYNSSSLLNNTSNSSLNLINASTSISSNSKTPENKVLSTTTPDPSPDYKTAESKDFSNRSEYFTPKSEDTDFLQKQMQSLHNAAKDTKALFQLGLMQDMDERPESSSSGSSRKTANAIDVNDKFVKDIVLASEQNDSLIIHDLENNSNAVVQETGESEDYELDNKVKTKIAFESKPDEYSPDFEPESEDEVITWNINNSIEVEKGKVELTTATTTTSKKLKDLKDSIKKRNETSTTEEEEEDDDDHEEEDKICSEFIPSKWNVESKPSKPIIKSPEQSFNSTSMSSMNNSNVDNNGSSNLDLSTSTTNKSLLKKSVSFERKKKQLIYEYPPPPLVEENIQLPTSSISLSLDWELGPEELEDALSMNKEDSSDDEDKKTENKFDVYRISNFEESNQSTTATASCSSGVEPIATRSRPILGESLGELCHKKDRLKLDLCKIGEASLLDEKDTTKQTREHQENAQVSGKADKLDSGVGSSSTNPSPFRTFSGINKCDNDHPLLK